MIARALPPEPFKAAAGGAGAVDGVPWVAVAEMVLDEPQVVALVGEREAAKMPQRVRVDTGQARRRGSCDEVVHHLAGQRLAALGDKQPGQRVGTGSITDILMSLRGKR